MLGYTSAERAVNLGREAFFGGPDVDLPPSSSPVIREDDRTPQFGYVGERYEEKRVLFFGINPGNGSRDTRSNGDEMMMPKLVSFRDNPSKENFRSATAVYAEACRDWPMWRLCSEVIGDSKLSFNRIAYANCLPWRTASKNFSDAIAERAAHLYALPLIEELKPRIVIALYKRAAGILEMSNRKVEWLIRWNGARAATEAVKRERAHAAGEIWRRLDMAPPSVTS